jgi:branched-chain amino acid transport system ATP-binding protein
MTRAGTGQVFLSLERLDLYYGDAQALSDVSLEVAKGEIVAIVGANGAGKSSLIRCIAGIESPRSGKILFNGKVISGLESHETCDLGIGQVAEGRQVFPSLTVLENLQMGAMLPRAARRSAISTTCSRSSRGSLSGATSSPAPCPAASSR